MSGRGEIGVITGDGKGNTTAAQGLNTEPARVNALLSHTMEQQPPEESSHESNSRGKAAKVLQAMREFVHGMVLHEPRRVALQEKVALERLLILALFGDMLGVPVFRPYYFLRLLPYVYPRIDPWKRSILREKDWTDSAFD